VSLLPLFFISMWEVTRWEYKILYKVRIRLPVNWRLVCRSWAFDCRYKIGQLFDARHGVKKRCQPWHRVILALNKSMPCPASFFDSKSRVKKLVKFVPIINCTTSAFKPSTVVLFSALRQLGQITPGLFSWNAHQKAPWKNYNHH